MRAYQTLELWKPQRRGIKSYVSPPKVVLYQHFYNHLLQLLRSLFRTLLHSFQTISKMQFTIVTLTNLFAAVLAAPSDVSARQAPLATLTTFRDSGCINGFAPTIPLYITPAPACRDLPAGIVGGKIFDTPRANCQSKSELQPSCYSLLTGRNSRIPRRSRLHLAADLHLAEGQRSKAHRMLSIGRP